MKHASRVVALALAVAGLSACASSEERTSYVAPQRLSSDPSAIEIDHTYVAYVERVARRRGIDVQWVHMPTKPASRE